MTVRVGSHTLYDGKSNKLLLRALNLSDQTLNLTLTLTDSLECTKYVHTLPVTVECCQAEIELDIDCSSTTTGLRWDIGFFICTVTDPANNEVGKYYFTIMPNPDQAF